MKQYTENQYDDDLTVGTDEYDDSYYTGSVDLFEFSNDEESPISRLKTLILSIDWEITDEILMQFNEELVDLRDIWAGEKINLVYVQALEKISKYIYQKKADSHPSAIKLLLTLYHNLEKIVSSFDLTDEEKKEILLEDVKRFESLKRHIAQPSQVAEESVKKQHETQEQAEDTGSENDLLNLKAIVLGIDWEITDQDLSDLRKEVIRLEGVFTGSKPKLILLQGIGTLGAYIKLKKSNAHADAFKILHLFYESLEKIVTTPMGLDEEKTILFPAVEKFNSFKAVLGHTIDAEAIRRDETETDESFGPIDSVAIEPAFADLPDEETVGFQAEKEAEALGIDNSGSIDNQVESFFTGQGFHQTETGAPAGGIDSIDRDLQERALQGVAVEEGDEEEADGLLAEHDGQQIIAEKSIEQPVEEAQDVSSIVGFEDEDKPMHDFSKLDRDVVLQGVDVETEADDDSDEEALPLQGGELAPALAENDEVSIFNEEKFEEDALLEKIDNEIEGTLGGFFDEEIEAHLSTVKNEEDSCLVDQEGSPVSEESVPLEAESMDVGIVETIPEAGDESISPASKLETEEESLDSLGDSDFEQSVNEFLPEDIALQGVDVETEADDDSGEEALPMLGGELAPALVENDEISIFNEEEIEHSSKLENIDDEIAGTLGGFFDEEIEAHVSAVHNEDDSSHLGVDDEIDPEETAPQEDENVISETEPDADDESITSVTELETEEGLDSFFDDNDLEQSAEGRLEEDLFDETFDSALSEEGREEDGLSEIDESLDNIFELEDNVEEPLEDQLDFSQPEESIKDEILSEDNLISPVLNDVQEEEVVFELVEEVDQLPTTEPDIEIGETPPIDEFLSAEDDLFSSDPVFEDEEIEDDSEDFVSTFETEKATEVYGTLQTCIESLGIELDDKVILGLWGEIDHLQQNLVDKPLEQTFLQLITTVTRHIDQNRYDSSSSAYGLLQSVYRALSGLQEDDVHQNLESLLIETRNVLNWQEEILVQQAERNEAELTIGDSMSADQESTQSSYGEPVQSYDENPTVESDESSGEFEHQSKLTDATFDNVSDQTDSNGKDRRLDEASESPTDWEDTKMLTDDLKQEISTLRKTLQDEIAELRKELKGNYQ